MSETPQSVLERYLQDGGIITLLLSHVREAIRAVLAQLRQAEILGDQAEQEREEAEAERDALRIASDEDARALLRLNDLLVAAEAERDALRAEVERLRAEGLAIADGQIADRERLRAALEEVRGLTKCASDVFLIRISSVAEQALHPNWRDGGVTP